MISSGPDVVWEATILALCFSKHKRQKPDREGGCYLPGARTSLSAQDDEVSIARVSGRIKHQPAESD